MAFPALISAAASWGEISGFSSICLLLRKQHRRDFVEIALPDRVGMSAAGDAINVFDLVLRELTREVCYRAEQCIFGAAAHPEELQLAVDAGGVRQHGFEIHAAGGGI